MLSLNSLCKCEVWVTSLTSSSPSSSQHIKVFITTPLMPAVQAQSQQRAGMGYFATFVHNIIEKCLKTRQLRNEFYCQLISLIAKYPEGKMEALQVCRCECGEEGEGGV